MDEMAKEISDALNKDFPGAKLKHAPFSGNGKPAEPDPTLSQEIDRMVAGLEARIRVLQALRATL